MVQLMEISHEDAVRAVSATANLQHRLNLFERRLQRWQKIHRQSTSPSQKFPVLRDLLLACGSTKAGMAINCNCLHHRPFPRRLRVFIPHHQLHHRPRGYASADSVLKNGKLTFSENYDNKYKKDRKRSTKGSKYWKQDVDIGTFQIDTVKIKRFGWAYYIQAERTIKGKNGNCHEHLRRKVYPPTNAEISKLTVRVTSTGRIQFKAPIRTSPIQNGYRDAEDLQMKKLSLEDNVIELEAPVSPLSRTPGSVSPTDMSHIPDPTESNSNTKKAYFFV